MADFLNQVNYTSAAAKFLSDEEQVYRAFSGSDMQAYIGHIRVGKLQGITCSITREIMPIYVAGDPNPKAFSKGKRGIAGNLVFTQFDRHAILRDIVDPMGSSKGAMSLSDLWAQAGNKAPVLGSTVPGNQPLVNYLQQSTNDVVQDELAETYFLVRNRVLNYVDMLPPFDITITLVNENSDAARLAIHGVQLINEGWGYTLDDLHSETAFTYIARAVTPLDSLANVMGNTGQQFNGLANALTRVAGGF